MSSRQFVDHVTPVGHPERPERAEVLSAVAAAFRQQGGEVIEPRLATDEDLVRVHTQEHVDAIIATRGKATMIDEDTFTAPDCAAFLTHDSDFCITRGGIVRAIGLDSTRFRWHLSLRP